METVGPNGLSYCISLPINTTYFSAEYIQKIIYETKLKLEQLYIHYSNGYSIFHKTKFSTTSCRKRQNFKELKVALYQTGICGIYGTNPRVFQSAVRPRALYYIGVRIDATQRNLIQTPSYSEHRADCVLCVLTVQEFGNTRPVVAQKTLQKLN